MLVENGNVSVNELSEKFALSKVTIRKYLDILEEKGIISKHYGGGNLIKNNLNIIRNTKDEKQNFNANSKKAIAKKASEHINSGDTIFLGSGATCTFLCDSLGEFERLTIVTNNISAIPKLLQSGHKLVIIGGETMTLDNINYFSWTENSKQYLDNIFVNKVFSSCCGIDLQAGLTVDAVVSVAMFQFIHRIKRKWILMAEESKFNKIAVYKFGDLNFADHVISDNIPKIYLDYFHKNNITTEIC